MLKIADIISTQTKIRVTASGVTQFLKYFISDDWIPLGIAISLNVVFGQMAQFSIIGSKHGIEVFKPAFINSFETYFLSAAVFFVANYAFNSPNSVACAFVAYYSLQLLGAMMVALTGESFLPLCSIG
ncbi:MAG: hypothetical protein HWD59_06580 [Coxiellaceae bacterium]|nr:MAG: hypothetical protein HWD59_06580 [Coxiellaceae bacterium]